MTLKEIRTMVTGKFLESIQKHLANHDFSSDAGDVRFIDRDDTTIFYGLFEVDNETSRFRQQPSIIWSIEVFGDVQGEGEADFACEY